MFFSYTKYSLIKMLLQKKLETHSEEDLALSVEEHTSHSKSFFKVIPHTDCTQYAHILT